MYFFLFLDFVENKVGIIEYFEIFGRGYEAIKE